MSTKVAWLSTNWRRRNARLLYLTPSHQFPTGATLDINRRREILQWATRTGAYVVEDDYDSDYRYDSPPIVSLAGADRSNNVIYVGTVSKSLGPGFRIGYMVVPAELADLMHEVKVSMSLGSQYIEQKIVCQFFRDGCLSPADPAQSARPICRQGMQRWTSFRGTLVFQISKYVVPKRECTICGCCPNSFPDACIVARRALQSGVRVHTITSAGAVDYKSGYGKKGLIIGYSSLTEEQAIRGIDVVARGHPRDEISANLRW